MKILFIVRFIQQSQDHLQEQTTEALSSLSKGNKALLEQQQYLKDAQATAHNLVTSNLRELNNEKALIRTGHTLLASMAEDIRDKLGIKLFILIFSFFLLYID